MFHWAEYFHLSEEIIWAHSSFVMSSQTRRWECLKELLLGDWTDGILCSFGMPVIKDSERYNCQVLCLNRKIIMIRPKMWLANDGNYRELRWFTAWKSKDHLEDFHLPSEVSDALSQTTVPFGYGYVQFLDTYVDVHFLYSFFRYCFAFLPLFLFLAVDWATWKQNLCVFLVA